jgi:transposase-like protein
MGALRATTVKCKKAILESLSKGATIIAAAKAAGVNPATVHKWRHKDRRFAGAVAVLLDLRITTVEDSLYARACNGNVTACIFYLCNRSPDRWKNVHNVHSEITGEVTHQVRADLAGLVEAARNNGIGIGQRVEQRRAFLGGGAAPSN